MKMGMSMNMDMEEKTTGLPFLDKPVMLHSSRESSCDLTPSECAYIQGHWRNWYQADHVYALNTVYFMVATIGVFATVQCARRIVRLEKSSSPMVNRLLAGLRFLSYRSFRIEFLGWWSPSLGVLLLGCVGMSYFFSITLGPKPYYWASDKFGHSQPIATRSGWMSIALLPFVLALSVKANLITALTGVSHEKLQVFHRWTSYGMFLLALIHTFPFIVKNIERGEMVMEWNGSIFYWSGVAALVPQAWLTLMSAGPIRKRFYELFKATHYLAALLFVLMCFFHCDYTLTSWDYFIAAGTIYVACLLFSQTRTYFAYGISHRATVTLLPADLIEVSIPIRADKSATTAFPVGFNWSPGQHVFIRFLGQGLFTWSFHPFTICSLAPALPAETPVVRMLIKPSGGFTAQMAKAVKSGPKENVRVLLDGPYGGLDTRSWSGLDKVLLVAGGSGAGFTLPIVESLIRACSHQDEKAELRNCPEIQVVLATKHTERAQWYDAEIQALLKRHAVSDVPLSVTVHVTDREDGIVSSSATSQDGEAKDVKVESDEPVSSSTTKVSARMCRGRPDLPLLVSESTRENGIALGIAVCGPAGMLYDIRNAAAEAQRRVLTGSGARSVYLHSEHFSW